MVSSRCRCCRKRRACGLRLALRRRAAAGDVDCAVGGMWECGHEKRTRCRSRHAGYVPSYPHHFFKRRNAAGTEQSNVHTGISWNWLRATSINESLQQQQQQQHQLRWRRRQLSERLAAGDLEHRDWRQQHPAPSV